MHTSTRGRWLEIVPLLLMAAGGCADAVVADTAVCDAHVRHAKIAVSYYDRVDILFVLDDSPSMSQERKHFLEQQLPRATELLLRGETPDRKLSMVPLSNLHFGVVSADMGVGADGSVSGCSASGDDGRLLNAAKCQASEPAFSWYYQGLHDIDATQRAIQCLADVGSAGCQVTQPLEAALKALWPAGSASAVTQLPVPSQDYTFRGDSQGHGLGANARFLRSQGALSLIVVIIITDQDDCSTHDPTTFTADANVGLSCLAHPDKLRAIQTYVGGLRSLRPDVEQLLVSGIIAGVPPEWVESVLEPARSRGFGDPMLLRGAFDALLSDPRMQADPSNLMPSCSSSTATATAPRRLMQFARNVGDGTYVQSICDYDLARMFADMFDIVSKRLGDWSDVCLSLPLVPDGQGLVPCRVTWELPERADPEEPLTPVSCAERPGVLSEPGPGLPKRGKRGALCEVRQAPVLRGSDGSIAPQGDGFFREQSPFCPAGRGLRVNFTERAKPPTGVTVSMECVDETQHAGPKLAGVPAIGDACLHWETLQGSDALCGNAAGDRAPGKLFCDARSNRCVLGCSEDRDCPREWVCDSASGSCIKPGCD